MAHIVQQAYAVNTVGVNIARAKFASPVTAGNAIFVSAGATDLGAAIAIDALGASYASLSDLQGNSFSAAPGAFPFIFGDRVNGKTLWFGMYLATSIQSGSDTITFKFTPITSAPNCQVGITIYEVAGLGSEILGSGDGGVDLAAHVFPVEGGGGGAGLGWSGQTNGVVVFVNGIATTNDGSTLNAGSGYALDGSAAAHIGSSFSTIGAESQFFSSANSSDACLFGNKPSSSSGISSIAMAAVFALTSAPDGGGNQNPGSNQGYSLAAPVVPNDRDRGHVFDGVLYFGTLTGWAGRTGVITPDITKGDTPFPVAHSGEGLSARAHIDDFTFVPVNGQRVQFYMLRNSAGDKLAISIAAL
jgi:hypothetical protein